MTRPLGRRDFLRTTAAVTACVMTGSPLFAEDKKPKLKKAVKYGMIQGGRTVRDRFEMAKRCGFAGVELDSPSGINRRAALKAQSETGVVIHGIIDSVHWN
ncbi:MAG: twin-arginine translocation signal domain-containing protein, partial [Planctomycetia bacterium]|nr:twin-arginine translocation signal domain-containing protein [Planctomycetia bacterium]